MSEARATDSAITGRPRRWRRRLGWGALYALGTAVGLLALKEAALRMVPFDATPRYPRAATIVEDRRGTELAAFVGEDDSWSLPLTAEEISPYLKRAMVAVEDRRFAEHGGVDWYSVAGAVWQDACSLRAVRGASTLSMQVVRLRAHMGHGLADKVAQAFRAQQLELHESKDEILTEYINRSPFGGNLVGAGAASWRYFGKSCRDLSLGQAALLAGLPQSPNRFRPDRSPELARARRAHVLDQMFTTHVISAEERDRANDEPLDAVWHALPQKTTHEAFGGLPTLVALAEAHPGRRVRATLDGAVQETAWRVMQDRWPALVATGVDSGAALVVDVPTGEVLAAVSVSAVAPGVDLTQAARSTGSVLKPFIYAAAFDMGIVSPGTEVNDSPKAWAGYLPANFDRGFRGTMTAGEALAESRNIPAMTVLAKVGVERAVGFLSEVGIRTPSRSGRNYGLSLAIGGAEASPLEVAEAYATLARGGAHVALHFTGAAATRSSRIVPEAVCWQTLGCLAKRSRTEAIAGAGDAAALEAAWKTGTSNGLRDAWCAAATPRRVVVVWLGNAEGRGSAALVGQDAAAPLALKLLGMIDSAGAGGVAWRTVPENKGPVRVLEYDRRLSVVSPAPNTEILTESDVLVSSGAGPGGAGRVALKSAGGKGERRWWFANGELVGVTENQTAWWRPEPGAYELRVIDEGGAGATVRVAVR